MGSTFNRYTWVSAALVLLTAACGSYQAERRSNTEAEPALTRSLGSDEEKVSAAGPVAAPAESPAPANRPVDALRKREEFDTAAGQASTAVAVRSPARQLAPASADDLAGLRPASEPLDRESYAHFVDNPLRRVAEHPVSTFSIDVDTGAYANLRRFLASGRLPPRDAVRIEELINYFDYAYPAPAQAGTPFSVTTEIGPSPWGRNTHLLHVGIKGYELPPGELPPANLVFLIDVSGSMRSPDKLGLLKSALQLLARRLRPEDHVAIAVYAGASGTVLEPTSGAERGRILAAIENLRAGGSTNGAAGIRLAYALAERHFHPGGVNRVILATDGDFNVGTTNVEQLVELVQARRASGIALTTLGFGMGNYNDHLLERIADAGDGNYAYIDTLNEARKVLVDELSATLLTIARDVKIQLEFNPALVSEYRLIGYVNRRLRREDFDNDRVDAGDIGAGHTVTALYEVALRGSGGERISGLRYGAPERPAPEHGGEIAYLRLRYKPVQDGAAPGEVASRLLEQPLRLAEVRETLEETSERYRFAAAVAAFGQLLRGGTHTGEFGLEDVRALARGARGEDPFGYRAEFVQLVSLAGSLSAHAAAVRD